MPRFFTEDITDGYGRVTGDDAHHISKSLRMHPGEEIELCDLSGFDYRCIISEISPGLVLARILEKNPVKSEPTVEISLYQALPKADKLDLIAQKSVELGVRRLVPVLTSRCVSRWSENDAPKKIARLQKIMLEAAKQSGRGIIPEVCPLCDFAEAVNGMKRSQLAILFYEEENTPLSRVLNGVYASAALMIGSEGGFSEREAAYAKENDIITASLGPRILRCETAAICALSSISFAMGEF